MADRTPRARLLPLLLLLPIATAPHASDTLEGITIEEVISINPHTAEPSAYNQQYPTPSDGGDFLRQINGISGSRFGGRGIDPILRGQSQTRINVLLDGSFVQGGCPNRMDPPSSWAALETYEEIRVLKGVQTLTLGGGGSGGTILFQRNTRQLAEMHGLHGRVGATFSDNQIEYDPSIDLVAASETGYLRAIGEIKGAGDYTDGDGNTIRSGFNHRQAGLILGYTGAAHQLFELSHEANTFTDALYSGAAMDSPEEQGGLTRLRYHFTPDHHWIDALKAELYRSDIDHVMDNYSLRTANPMMQMRTPTTSLTTGGRLALKSTLGAHRVEVGIDLQRNERDAELIKVSSAGNALVAPLWPEIAIQQTGLFAEALLPIGEHQKIRYGLRIDRVESHHGKANARPDLMMGHTAADAYRSTYGTTAHDRQETHLSLLLRHEATLNPGLSLFTGLSRTVRTADATERGINKWVADPLQRWIGNPALRPEQHHQLDVGLTASTRRYSASLSLFYDRVNDYILRDVARGQPGILIADGSEIFRNIDAELAGFEIEGRTAIAEHLELSLSAAYVRATNRTDHRAIAQTPPLNGTLQLDYQRSRWGLGARIRIAASQNRVDLLSRQEVGASPGYGVLDLYGNAELTSLFSMRFGFDNLLDQTYAEHVSRSNLMESRPTRVNEPGRTAWLKLTAEF